jgi:endonuclease YncB( thermonuclease family)
MLVGTPASGDFSGRVVTVHDGDTLTVMAGSRATRVRLEGIDAPERGQRYGAAARSALAGRVAGRCVLIVEHGLDSYGRVLGRVHVGGDDVNAEQVRSGYAWVFRRYSQDPVLLAFEAEAKAARRGLWRDVRPIAPWRWRERSAHVPEAVPLAAPDDQELSRN